jgi:MarR family transcriptional regulator for hemolysin
MDPALLERFSYALQYTARAWRMTLERRLKSLDLSQASWLAMSVVSKCTTLSQTELATRLGVEDATMVTTIDRLVKNGYLVRVPSETDRRVKLVRLTEHGKEVYARLQDGSAPFCKDLLACVDHGQIERFTNFMEALQADIGTPDHQPETR